jgi:hypothetical protein
MTSRRFDLLALGNAIVDVVAAVDDDVLVAERIPKGSMSLIDEARADALLSRVPGAVRFDTRILASRLHPGIPLRRGRQQGGGASWQGRQTRLRPLHRGGLNQSKHFAAATRGDSASKAARFGRAVSRNRHDTS